MRITHSQKGFTLLETLVAISILLIAVVAPMSIIGRSLPQSAYARDHAIAVNLAQEGIEAVRQKRDSNMLADWNGPPDVAWDNGIVAGNYYAVDPRALSMLISCGGSMCNPIRLTIRQDATTGLYYQSSVVEGTATKFQRQIEIQSSASGLHEKQVISVVTWYDSMNIPHTLTIKESILGINITP